MRTGQGRLRVGARLRSVFLVALDSIHMSRALRTCSDTGMPSRSRMYLSVLIARPAGLQRALDHLLNLRQLARLSASHAASAS